MQLYAYCGFVIRSAVPLPELEVAGRADARGCAWTCSPGSRPGAPSGRAVHAWVTDDGDPWLDIARHGERYVLRFSAGPTFVVGGDRIVWEPAGDIPPATVRHLLLDQVLPLAMSARGDYVLHAAAVRVAGRAVIFAGPSGRGKSTLAAHCVASGGTLLADDCVRITAGPDGFVAHTSYPGLRLWPDAAARVHADDTAQAVAHYTRKVRIPTPSPAGSAPVDRIYLLERSSAGVVREIPGDASAALDLTRFVFRIDPTHREHVARDFAATAALVNAGIVRRLIVPDSLDVLHTAARFIDDSTGAAVGVRR